MKLGVAMSRYYLNTKRSLFRDTEQQRCLLSKESLIGVLCTGLASFAQSFV